MINDAGDILEKASQTFSERNSLYGDNFKKVAPIIKVLFPNGVPKALIESDVWHLFELKIVKLTRFSHCADFLFDDTVTLTDDNALSMMASLIDSIHDDCIYSAMIESCLRKDLNQNA